MRNEHLSDLERFGFKQRKDGSLIYRDKEKNVMLYPTKCNRWGIALQLRRWVSVWAFFVFSVGRCGAKEIEAWLGGRSLDDGLLAEYITGIHAQGKSPATISQMVAVAKWLANNHGIKVVGEITSKTLAGIRREGKDRGKGQVDGVEREDMLRVVTFAESEKTTAGLRDAALIRLMSDCLLRISEAVAVNVGDLQKSTLRIKSSKTDQEGRGEVLYVGGPTTKLIDRYCTKADISRGALFCRVLKDGKTTVTRLTPEAIREIVKKRSKGIRGVKGRVSGHSLRVGSAVSLARGNYRILFSLLLKLTN